MREIVKPKNFVYKYPQEFKIFYLIFDQKDEMYFMKKYVSLLNLKKLKTLKCRL